MGSEWAVFLILCWFGLFMGLWGDKVVIALGYLFGYLPHILIKYVVDNIREDLVAQREAIRYQIQARYAWVWRLFGQSIAEYEEFLAEAWVVDAKENEKIECNVSYDYNDRLEKKSMFGVEMYFGGYPAYVAAGRFAMENYLWSNSTGWVELGANNAFKHRSVI